MKCLAQRLTALRGNRSQTELARKAGIPQSAISEIEAGKRIPRTDTLQKLATALGVSVAELLDDEPLPKAVSE
ncbi:HTH-type transcriptional regulator Xre [Pelotomaculum schinkii]|uniref:HTH-type transcriptional regulator Xre n=1 Tax=Pelotomaculum schinkii TaxID=78350 RepID=A0A4Y7R755_9FIRM|nr:helix-turn-helix transcriptional regulator [Pelotomaculum schinkii]TEB04784.1 HTH-type transcriptional regulator Xre [Pelotomaculum schinkii]